MSDELLGDDFRLFWDSNDDFASPTWVEEVSIGDLGFDPQNEQVEIPIRIPVKVYKKGRGDWTLSFTMNYDKSNTFHMAVRDAITTGDPIHLAIADGDSMLTADYWHAWWMLSGSLDAALDSNATIEVEGKVHHDRGDADDELPAFVEAA
jgi:hypothetical protein